MKKRFAAGLAVLALTAPAGLVVTAGTSDAAALRYANCTALAKRFHHGVSKSRSAALYQHRQGYGTPAYGALAKKVYWANYRSMDRDKDGTACER